MRLLVLAFPLLAATSSLAAGNGQDEVTRSFQKTVALSGNQGLSLDHSLWPSAHSRRRRPRKPKSPRLIRVQDSNANDAQEFLQKIQIEVREDSDGVHIKTIYPENKFPRWRIGGHSSFSVDYDITMPA